MTSSAPIHKEGNKKCTTNDLYVAHIQMSYSIHSKKPNIPIRWIFGDKIWPILVRFY